MGTDTYTIDSVVNTWWDQDQQKMFATVAARFVTLGSTQIVVDVTLDATTKTAISNAVLALLSS